MESNAAVTLQFEDLAIKKYLFFKRYVHLLVKISNCVIKYFDQFKKILSKKCSFVHTVTLSLPIHKYF